MYGQYDTYEENEYYEKEWKKLFNTAVIPLYWEGTEPIRDHLRYTADTPNDMYRRPNAESVVNWCEKNGVRKKGHPLFWHEFIPEWLPEDWKELYPLFEKRMREISGLFADRIPVFDCVNEPARIWNVEQEHKTMPGNILYLQKITSKRYSTLQKSIFLITSLYSMRQ